MPTSYIIVDISVSNAEAYDQYKALAPAAVAGAGGEFVARGGRLRVLEGDWQPTRIVVLRFPSYEHACAFYDSALYTEARARRTGATQRFNMVVVEGLGDAAVAHFG